MKFRSTRNNSPTLSFSDAMLMGLAPDGGLYVPESFPTLTANDFAGLTTASEIGHRLLAPFFVGDQLESALPSILKSALNFEMPLIRTKGGPETALQVLELFHGPTCAFKDIGARFLAACVEEKLKSSQRQATILVATSGDTGGAVAGAFFKKNNIKVVILYPNGGISARQEKQLTCWGENIRAFAVDGNFDDCQRMVKEAFTDVDLKSQQNLMSANSISIGRLLPQMIYYAQASLSVFRKTQKSAHFVIPSGNLGNSVAAMWARKIGLPIDEIVLATNANTAIKDFFASQVFRSKKTVATLANAMDVGNPSNVERLQDLFYPNNEQFNPRDHHLAAVTVSDQQIRETIKQGISKYNQIWCPHTATAVFAAATVGTSTQENLATDSISGSGVSEIPRLQKEQTVIVATAHPAKFEAIVEPLIGKPVAVPPELQKLITKNSPRFVISPTLEKLIEVI